MDPFFILAGFAADVVGWAGMTTVVAAYMYDQDALHLAGAMLLASYSAYYRMWPQVVTNVVWMGVAAAKRKKTEEEPRAGVEPAISTLEG